MSRPRPAYLERKLAYLKNKREARRTHVQPCDCGYCLTQERMVELTQAALARNPATEQDINF